jgi:hypothetical protein|tara:strand:- start:233 stop:445 length:213 start_codon:yes stop_codon:yes gene_type:complete
MCVSPGERLKLIIMNLNEEINKEFSRYQEDFILFTEKGNKSAGTRARKSLMNISKLCKEIRKEIQGEKNS